MATVEFPIRGDVNQYVLYAWNLSHRGAFSTALPHAETVNPDSYRGPGYPAFLAATMILAGHSDLPLRPGPAGQYALGYASDTWMRIALGLQILLGTATVWLVIVLARLWLPDGGSLVAGLITASWPHLVTFTGVLLSETLFAFLLVLALWMLCRAYEAGGWRHVAGAGVTWGIAYLVNPIVAFFPIVAAAAVAGGGKRKVAAIFLVGFALMPGLWAMRNALNVRDSGALQRMEENFVQGSWPEFLIAFNSRFDNNISRQIVEAANDEVRQFKESTITGLSVVAERMAQDPLYYCAWYLARKPYLLWDWSIRVGTGDIYFLPVQHSAFEKIPILSGIRDALRWLNPLIFALSVFAALTILGLNLLRRQESGFAAFATSLLALYLTAVHVVLQAEPRYSIPYRPEEILLAVTTIAWVADRWSRRRTSRMSDSASS
jgi:4-amino-4-deoxy-L-arabinose transferase-like glycosyltransferase